MPAPLPVRTPRLVLRPFAAGDLDAFAAYRADPAVAAYQSWDAGYSRADAERFLAEQEPLALGAPGEWVQVAIADARDDALLGGLGFRLEGRHVEADWFKGHWTTLRLYALLAREHAR